MQVNLPQTPSVLKNSISVRDRLARHRLRALPAASYKPQLKLMPGGGESRPSVFPQTQHPITILLIDDRPIVAEAVRKMLAAEMDMTLHYCQNPTEAISMAIEIAPTVILQDLIMPEIDGLKLVRFLRAKDSPTRDIPLVVLSSKEDPKTKAEAFALGANDYLVKLPNAKELIARIRYHSKAYTHLLERNAAYQAMQDSLAKLAREKEKTELALKTLVIEKEKSDRLLLNILPKSIADRLKKGEDNIVDIFPQTSVLFADIVGFTRLASDACPKKLVGIMNVIFSAFDALAEQYDLEKIKTIGDAYMLVSGLPIERDDHAEAIADVAIAMQETIDEIQHILEPIKRSPEDTLNIRIGIHSGPVVAGIIGRKKFLYDLWGDTVNTASRMESYGSPDRIHVSEATYQLLKDKYRFEQRASIHVKGKGMMTTYFLNSKI
jgi:adenylate cyclase